MAGRYIKDEVIDVIAVTDETDLTDSVTDVTDKTPKKTKISLLRRLILTFVWWLPAMCIFYFWQAFAHPTRTDSTFLWELGYQLGSVPWWVPAVCFPIGWFLVPLAYSPDR